MQKILLQWNTRAETLPENQALYALQRLISELFCSLFLIHNYFFYNFFNIFLSFIVCLFSVQTLGYLINIYIFFALENIKKTGLKSSIFMAVWLFFSLQPRLPKNSQQQICGTISGTCALYEDASIIYFINDLVYKKRIHACTWKEKALLFPHVRTHKRHQTQLDENTFWSSSTIIEGDFIERVLLLNQKVIRYWAVW